MGATAFQKGLGAIHASVHPVGALYDTHHGLTNAVFMPYVLAFNRPAIEAKIERLAAWLGLSGGLPRPFWAGCSRCARSSASRTRWRRLGIGNNRFEEMAEMAIKDPTAGGNPRELTLTAARTLFDDAWGGVNLGD